jgi:NAD(P)-dependent dehydrogenase (short-subunit alcohol dehydrogenase family)
VGAGDEHNAAFQMRHPSLDEVSDEEWDHTPAADLTPMFILCRDATPHMQPGASMISSSSVNSATRARTWPPTP